MFFKDKTVKIPISKTDNTSDVTSRLEDLFYYHKTMTEYWTKIYIYIYILDVQCFLNVKDNKRKSSYFKICYNTK